VENDSQAGRRITLTVTPSDVAAYKLSLLTDPCAYCDAQAQVLDHVVPKARGGGDRWDNRAGACHACNGSKGVYSLLGFLAALIHRPRWTAAEVERAAWRAI
jgi:5-methylcytosine-specific restriction endonuclease McrA